MSDHVSLQFTENGPIVLEGEIEVVGPDGKVITEIKDVSLCRCGLSQNKPFCDGHHETSGFHAPSGIPSK